MGEPGYIKNSQDEKPADRNRRIRLWLHRWVDEMAEQLTDPEFTGSVELTINSKDGRLTEPKTTRCDSAVLTWIEG